MFRRRRIAYVEPVLSAFIVYGLIASCTPGLQEFKAPLGPGQELVTLATRPGVTVRVFLISPATDPKGIFVFFPGGEGTLVNTEGRPGYGSFTSLFSKEGFVTAIVDVPFDYAYGYGSGGVGPFRASKEHTEDIRRVIDFVGQRWSKPIFLIGHSAGTLSVAHLGSVLRDQHIGGLVLLAAVGTVGRSGLVSLSSLPLHDIIYPILFVHHKEDDCTSFQAVHGQLYRLTNSPRVNFIEVLGGDQSRAVFCSPANPIRSPTHGLSGKEREVSQAITDWALVKSVPERIGP